MGYDNLAYQWDDEETVRRREKKRKSQQEAKRRAMKMKHIKYMVCMVLFTLTAYFMVCKYVAVYETQNQIKDLQKQLATKQSYTSQKVFELEKSVDLNTIEQQATARLNMQRPDKTQTIYVNVQKADVTEVTAGSVESMRSRIERNLVKLKEFIVSIFTLN